MKQQSQRQLRVAESIRHMMIETLQRGKFHTAELMDASNISINEVRVSPDLKNATAYVSQLGGDIDALLPALNHEAAEFQKDINRKADLKFTPRIKFVADHSQENVARLESIFHELENE